MQPAGYNTLFDLVYIELHRVCHYLDLKTKQMQECDSSCRTRISNEKTEYNYFWATPVFPVVNKTPPTQNRDTDHCITWCARLLPAFSLYLQHLSGWLGWVDLAVCYILTWFTHPSADLAQSTATTTLLNCILLQSILQVRSHRNSCNPPNILSRLVTSPASAESESITVQSRFRVRDWAILM